MRWKLQKPYFTLGETSYVLGKDADSIKITTDADGYFETDGCPALPIGLFARIVPEPAPPSILSRALSLFRR